MLIKGEQLASQLQQSLRPVYTLYGDSPLLTIEAADLVRHHARLAGFTEREILTAQTGFDWRQLSACGQNLSLFAERRLIDLRIPNGKPGKEGGAALQHWCQAPPPDHILLVTLPELDWRDEKASWLTALTEAGVTVKNISPSLTELPGWLEQRLKRQQQTANLETLRFMAERIEGNLLAAHQELQKLALLYPAGPLSLEMVRAAVLNVARYDIETLREALLLADLPRLNRTLTGLRQEGEAPPLILWAVAEEIRTLAQIRQSISQGTSMDQALKQGKVWGPRAAMVKRACSRLSGPQLEHALTLLHHADKASKGLGIEDFWACMQQIALLICPPSR